MSDLIERIKSEIEEIEDELEEIENEIERYESGDYEEEFKEYLRSEYGPDVEICGTEYDIAFTLKNVDEIAYNQEFEFWSDERIDELEDRKSELERDLEDLKKQLEEVEEDES